MHPLDRQRETIRREGLGAIVAFSPENIAHGTGFVIPSQVIGIRKRVFAAVVTADRESLMVASVEQSNSEANSRIHDVRAYNEFEDNPMDVLAAIIGEFGVSADKVGVEIDFLPGRHWDRLRRNLPSVTWVDAEAMFNHIRAVKTADEIEVLRTVGHAANDAYRRLAEIVEPGWSEVEVGLRLIEHVLTHGADGIQHLVVASGARSILPNGLPTERILNPGDVVRLDLFARRAGYLTDIARTMVVGRASPSQKDIWAKLCEAETLLLDMIRPGASTRTIWNAFLDRFEKMGLSPSINFVGHGLGLSLHEEPFINRFSDHALEEGMVLAIEPLHFQGDWGFHLEDEVIVGRDGVELISDGRGPLVELT